MSMTSQLSPEMVEAICVRLAAGEMLSAICRDDGMPTRRTVSNWCREHEWVRKAYEAARTLGNDAIAESCLDIADATDRDYKSRDTTGSKLRDPQRDKLRVWTRMKLLAVWDPERFAERQKLEHSGKVGIEQLVTASRKPAAE